MGREKKPSSPTPKRKTEIVDSDKSKISGNAPNPNLPNATSGTIPSLTSKRTSNCALSHENPVKNVVVDTRTNDFVRKEVDARMNDVVRELVDRRVHNHLHQLNEMMEDEDIR